MLSHKVDDHQSSWTISQVSILCEYRAFILRAYHDRRQLSDSSLGFYAVVDELRIFCQLWLLHVLRSLRVGSNSVYDTGTLCSLP